MEEVTLVDRTIQRSRWSAYLAMAMLHIHLMQNGFGYSDGGRVV